MKFRTRSFVLYSILVSCPVFAAEVSWDSDGTSGVPSGGMGDWDTSLPLWDELGTMRAWDNSAGDTALFGDLPGTVTLTIGISAAGLKFTSAGYTIAGNALTLAGSAPTITADQNVTISSALLGSNGMVKAGAGVLTLSGSNSFTGVADLSAGTLALDSLDALAGGGTISMNGGTLRFSATNTSDYTAGGRLKIEDGQVAGIDTNGQSVSFASPFTLGAAKTGGLRKSGLGSLTLLADNLYTGITSVSGGTLVLDRTAGAQLYKTGAFFGANGVSYLNVNTGGTLATYNWDYGTNGALDQLRNNYYSINLDGGTIRIDDTFSAQRAFQVGSGGGTLEVTAGNSYTKLAGTTVNQNIIRFTANSTLTITGAGNTVIEDGLGPAATPAYGNNGFGITKTGAGSLTLSGFSRYTGNTTLSGGTTKVTGGIYQGNYQAGAVLTLNGGASLELNSWAYDQGGSTQSLGGLRASNNALVVNNGTLRMVGTTATSYGRGLTVQSGGATFEAAAGANWTLAYDAGVANVYTGNPSLTLTGEGVATFDKVINSGTGGLTKSGSGTWSLTRANTYTGNTAISGGTLNLTGAGGIYTGATKGVANSIVISGGGVLVGDRWSWGANQSLGMLNFNNGYIAVNNGTIRNAAAASNYMGGAGNSRGIAVGAGGLTIENAISGTTWTWDGGGGNNNYATNATLTLAGVGNGVFGQTVSGSGVELSKTGSGKWSLTGPNNHAGATTITGGTLALGANNVLPNLSPITLGSATLDAAGFSDAVGKLDVTGAATIHLGPLANLDFADSKDIDWSGTLSLTGAFVSGESLNFGPGGLTTTQLSKISSLGFTSFALDDEGDLIATPTGGYDTWAIQITNGKTLRIQDADDDGFTNLQEFLFGTDPLAGDGSLTTTETSGGDLIIRWNQLTSGASYVLKKSATLADDWLNATAATIETDGPPDDDYQPMKATISIDPGRSFFRVDGVEN